MNEVAKIFYQVFSLVILLISIVFVPINVPINYGENYSLGWRFFTILGNQYVWLKIDIYIIQIISVFIAVLGFYRIIFKKF